MSSALIVIDVQESFRHRPYWRGDDVPDFLRNTQALIDHCKARGIAVLQVFHQDGPDVPGNPFAPCSGLVRPMPELRLEPDAVFHKSVHSALFGKNRQGTALEQWLGDHGVGEILITGIRTEQCCETTTRHASDVGYRVRYVSDATLTFPMESRTGRLFSAADIRERTELVLDGRFARVVSTAQVLE